jgi:hypothetical protein
VVLGQNANNTIKTHYNWGNFDCTLGKTTRYCVFLGQNANKTMKMHYHWGNLDCKLGLKTRKYCVALGQNANKTMKMHYPWGNLGCTLDKNHEISWFCVETRLKLRIQADREDGGGGVRDDEGRGGHQALRPLQQHSPHPQDRQGQAIKRLSRRNLKISHVLRHCFL